MTDGHIEAWQTRSRRNKATGWTTDQRRQLKELWFVKPPIPVEELAETLETSPQNVYSWAHKLGLPRRIARGEHWKGKRGGGKRSLPEHGGSARRFVGVDPAKAKGPKIVLAEHHPAMRKATTFFPGTVKPAAMISKILKSGVNSRKIGAKITKGPWKGMPIHTLTLVERETCPRSCKEFATCYGNNMHWADRIHDDGTLQKRIWAELAVLSINNPAGFVVRLHVLGDFDSVEYVEFWRQCLIEFPALHVFGFTARIPPDPIGNAVAKLTADFYERFRMRFSGGGHKTDCSEVVDKAEDVNFVRCPAETNEKRYCGNCALCMHSNVSISFVRH